MVPISRSPYDGRGRCASSGSKWERSWLFPRGPQRERDCRDRQPLRWPDGNIRVSGRPDPPIAGDHPAGNRGAGGKMQHVIRTRMFVTDVSKWEEVARVHGEIFADIRPPRASCRSPS